MCFHSSQASQNFQREINFKIREINRKCTKKNTHTYTHTHTQNPTNIHRNQKQKMKPKKERMGERKEIKKGGR